MPSQNFWDVVLALFSILGGTATLVPLAGWLAARLLAQRFAKDVEDHKKKLEAENAKVLASLTHDLEKRALEHEVQYRRIDKDVAVVLNEVYLHLEKFYEAVSNCVKFKRDVGTSPLKEFSEERDGERFNEAAARNSEFQTYMITNRPMISKRLFRQLQNVSNALIDLMNKFRHQLDAERLSNSGVSRGRDYYFDEVIEELDIAVSPAFSSLVDSIQQRLGVYESETDPPS